MKFRAPANWFAWLAGAAVLTGGTFAAREGLRDLRNPAGLAADPRYAHALPAIHRYRALGFLTDEAMRTDAWALRFHRAQYAVIPTMLYPNTEPRLLLVDLRDPLNLPRLLRAGGLRVLQDLGDGLAIVEQLR